MKIPLTARLILTLTLTGLLSGLIIVGVYELTRPRILANQAARLRAAVFEVLPDTATLVPLAWEGGGLRPAEGESASSGPAVFAGYADDGSFRGWAIPAEGAGFQDTIRLLYGWDAARGRIVGMRVLESRETPGLGDRIVKDEAFVHAFDDLVPERALEAVKDGATKPWQVDAISGATISSQAIIRIINREHELWSDRLPADAGAVPTPPEASR